MAGIKQYLEIHSAALSLRNKKNEIIASNIANAATPNYKARDLDFNSEMSRHLKSGNLTTTNDKHFSLMRPVSHKGVSYREPLQQSFRQKSVLLAPTLRPICSPPYRAMIRIHQIRRPSSRLSSKKVLI